MSLLQGMSPVMAPSSGSGMSAIPPLSGNKQTSGERAESDASDPEQTYRSVSADASDAGANPISHNWPAYGVIPLALMMATASGDLR
jgi:hypothetical protein